MKRFLILFLAAALIIPSFSFAEDEFLPPENLRATNVAYTTVTIAWDIPPNVDYDEITVRVLWEGGGLDINGLNGASRFYTVGERYLELRPDTVYRINVVGKKDLDGNGTYLDIETRRSDTIEIRTRHSLQPGGIEAIDNANGFERDTILDISFGEILSETNLTATNISEDEVILSWDTPPDDDYQHLYLFGNTNLDRRFQFYQIGEDLKNQNSVVVRNLQPSTDYEFLLMGFSEENVSRSPILEVRTVEYDRGLGQNADFGGRGNDNFIPAEQPAGYGLKFREIQIGENPAEDGHPQDSSITSIATGWAWGGDVAGWLYFNPTSSLPFLPPQNVQATPVSPTAIRLDWQNVSAADDLQIFATNDNGQFEGRPQIGNLQNQTSFTVQGLQPDTNYGFYLHAEDRENFDIVAEASTPVVEGRTPRRDPGGGGDEEANYTLWCDQPTINSIRLNWLRNNDLPEYELSLYGSVQGGELALLEGAANLQPQNTGSFIHQGLTPATDYQYQLKVSYMPEGEELWPAAPIICGTVAEPGEGGGSIVGLNVYPLSRTSLFLNWTDRSRQSRLYDLRRLRITPEAAVIGSAEVLGETVLKPIWTNSTNLLPDKTPFKQTVQRAVGQGGNFAVAGDPIFDNRPANQNTNYSFIDNGLTEGTVYQYRVETCATTLVDLRRDGELAENQEVCAPYSNVFEQVTRPAAPTGLTARADVNDPQKIALSWNDNSANEDGYELNWLRGDVAGEAVFLEANAAAYIYESLEPGVYVFSLKSFKNFEGQKVFSASATVELEVSEQAPPPGGQSFLEDEDRGALTANIIQAGRILSLAWENLAEKAGGFLTTVFGSVKKTWALQLQDNFDRDYFGLDRRVVPQDGRAFTPANFPAAYRDEALNPDTVYLYRLEVLDAVTGQRLAGTEPIYGAGETLPTGNGVPQEVKVCVRNNFCQSVLGERVGDNWPENQCSVNGDCRNVGSFYTIIKEN